ncbi:casein kinase II beta chain 1 [Actinidia rufa]|uniref:Casein kinase II subunit beta n=1 Tax=Actinidia rufa TaxID=165716 RepID=A0A7J0FRA8_9ERIC|nr:casein kinase II beta chain 1 [Actinidia rufa]
MARPWTEKAPMKSAQEKKIALFELVKFIEVHWCLLLELSLAFTGFEIKCSYFADIAEEYETDSEESDVSGSDGDDTSWISCQVPYYDYALDLILDVESSHGDIFTEEQNELVESAAEMLYGLIHVRYILAAKGMATMLEKYKNYDFGRCPRVYCCGQPCLPVGQSDIPRSSTVKIYCPKCEDIYYPRSKYQGTYNFALLSV